MAFSEKVNFARSERAAVAGSRRIGPADPNEIIDVTVYVARRSKATRVFPHIEDLGLTPIAQRRYLTREEFATMHGAAREDLTRIREFAQASGLRVKSENIGARSVVLTGSVSAFSRAFEADLGRYEYPGGAFRGRTGALKIPIELVDIIEAVVGLDNRPQASAHFRIRKEGTAVAHPSVSASPFTPVQVAELYDFPTGATGAGQCIGILELGGGYNTSDLTSFFGNLGLTVPSVTAVSIDGGTNSPVGNPNSADAEVALDIEVAGAVAQGAKIAVYFAPNTDQGFLDALTTAIHDTTNKPSVISISWGGPENTWTDQSMTAMDSACQDAATLGVSICIASGDNGATDGETDGQDHVDFPASSPSVLGCGGTLLEANDGKIVEEDVWNDLSAGGGATGGGVSEFFALPSWQDSANVPKAPNGFVGRGVPDVAGDADPDSGYEIVVDGQSEVVGGTSAVAPLWAGLIALMNQQLGKAVGFFNPLIYAAPEEATFHEITSGNNDGYSAGPGWNPCTGLGSPDGTELVEALGDGSD